MSLAVLLGHTLLLSLLAAVSPVMFLNGSRVAVDGGLRDGIRFAIGAAAVLLTLGVATMGLMGAAVAAMAQRELASRSVDAGLAVVLLGYGVKMAVDRLRGQVGGEAALPDTTHGMVAWGALGMATNFTTLPLFISVTQRIGASTLGVLGQSGLLLATVVVVATPAWLPTALAAAMPSRHGISPATRARVSGVTQLVSIAACLLGGLVLLWHVVG